MFQNILQSHPSGRQTMDKYSEKDISETMYIDVIASRRFENEKMKSGANWKIVKTPIIQNCPV